MGFFSDLFGGGGSGDEAAAYAAAMERRRQRRIGTGTRKINQQFGQFDDDFFRRIEQAALDFYNPQVDQQADDARRQLIFSLARGPGVDSSAAERRLGGLQERTSQAYATVSDRARQAGLGARSDVEGNRSELMSQLRQSADPSAAATGAINRANLLAAPRSFSLLGDLFAGLTGTAATNTLAGASVGNFETPGAVLFRNPLTASRVVT